MKCSITGVGITYPMFSASSCCSKHNSVSGKPNHTVGKANFRDDCSHSDILHPKRADTVLFIALRFILLTRLLNNKMKAKLKIYEKIVKVCIFWLAVVMQSTAVACWHINVVSKSISLLPIELNGPVGMHASNATRLG